MQCTICGKRIRNIPDYLDLPNAVCSDCATKPVRSLLTTTDGPPDVRLCSCCKVNQIEYGRCYCRECHNRKNREWKASKRASKRQLSIAPKSEFIPCTP